MKMIKLVLVALILILTFSSLKSDAELMDQWTLPNGAIGRIGKGRASEVKYFPDGNRIAIACSIGVWIYDLQTDEIVDVLIGHTRPVNSIEFSPDGKTLVTASDDNTAWSWDADTGQHKASFIGHRDDVNDVSISSDGNILATASDDDTVRLWDLDTGEFITVLGGGHTDNIHALTFSPDGKVIVSGSYRFGNTVCFWDVNAAKLIRAVNDEEHGVVNVETVACLPTGSIFATGSRGKICIWDGRTGELIQNCKIESRLDSVYALAFAPDGKTLASGLDNNSICIWDTKTQQLLETFKGHTRKVQTLVYSPDSQVLAFGNDDVVYIWDLSTGQNITSFIGHTSLVTGLSFSPDGKTIASACRDGTILLWDLKTLVENR